MLSFAALCRDLFLLAQGPTLDNGTPPGYRWEQRIADHLAMRGVPVEAVPGGCRIFGHTSLSGLAHQIDSTLSCHDAFVIGEWKAHRTLIPKNDLLHFKAATDDYYTAIAGAVPTRPIMRIFGGRGRTSAQLRRYAAIHGITIIDPEHWPAPVLAAPQLKWPQDRHPTPSLEDRSTLAWLGRPLQDVLEPLGDRAFRIAPMPTETRIMPALELQDYWSGRLWDAVDSDEMWFENLRSRTATAVA